MILALVIVLALPFGLTLGAVGLAGGPVALVAGIAFGGCVLWLAIVLVEHHYRPPTGKHHSGRSTAPWRALRSARAGRTGRHRARRQ